MGLTGLVVPPIATSIAGERPTDDARPGHGQLALLCGAARATAGVRTQWTTAGNLRVSIAAPVSRSPWLHWTAVRERLGTGSRGAEPTQHPHKSGSQTLMTSLGRVKRLPDWQARRAGTVRPARMSAVERSSSTGAERRDSRAP